MIVSVYGPQFFAGGALPLKVELATTVTGSPETEQSAVVQRVTVMGAPVLGVDDSSTMDLLAWSAEHAVAFATVTKPSSPVVAPLVYEVHVPSPQVVATTALCAPSSCGWFEAEEFWPPHPAVAVSRTTSANFNVPIRILMARSRFPLLLVRMCAAGGGWGRL